MSGDISGNLATQESADGLSTFAFSSDALTITMAAGGDVLRYSDTVSLQSSVRRELLSRTINGIEVPSITGLRAFSVPVLFGVPFDIGFSATGTSQSRVSDFYPSSRASATSGYEFGDSIYWGGVESVTVGGQNINDFQLMTASGVDYSRSFAPVVAAIPEPETYMMFAAGLLLMSAARRRFRSA